MLYLNVSHVQNVEISKSCIDLIISSILRQH
jgi:hypothetical protein